MEASACWESPWEQTRGEREGLAVWLAASCRAMREARLALERGELGARERYKQAQAETDLAVAAAERLLAFTPTPVGLAASQPARLGKRSAP